jgi:hypothetical protein
MQRHGDTRCGFAPSRRITSAASSPSCTRVAWAAARSGARFPPGAASIAGSANADGHAQPGGQRAAAEKPEGAAESAVARRSQSPAGSRSRRKPAGDSRSGDVRTVLLLRPAPGRTRGARPVLSRRPAGRRGARPRQTQQAAPRAGRQQGQGSGRALGRAAPSPGAPTKRRSSSASAASVWACA